ncbi:MAG TPA: hypothetical protein VGJ48_25470 [Pyrinomonadaceae bacterium]
MKTSPVRSLAHLFVIIVLCGATFAQSSKRAASPSPTTAQTPTLPQASHLRGVVTGSVYENDYFGLRFAVPTGWSIHDDATKKNFMERGKAEIVAKDDQDRAGLDAAAERTLILFTASKIPLASTGQFNAVFMVLAEPVSLSTTVPGYIEQLKSILQQGKTPVSFSEEQVETINGVQFHTFTTTFGSPANLVRQRFYLLIKKGHALALISTIVSDSDTEVMNSIIKSVSVK